MAKKNKNKPKKPSARKVLTARGFHPVRWLWRWIFRLCLITVAVVVIVVFGHSLINPTTSYYMTMEERRLGGIDHHWVPLEDMAPVMARSLVAAEDANFCSHWGFDMKAIRAVIEQGGAGGASTISQQVVKNVYLWHGRSWVRKALEAAMTPLVELLWSKRRIVEVYLNVAEFDEGVFGIEAAARHYFGVGPENLTAEQAARLAAVLPAPKVRSASRPGKRLRRRAAGIQDGAATIRRDGRSDCFETKTD